MKLTLKTKLIGSILIVKRNTIGIRDVSNELAIEATEAAQQAAELSELSYQLQQEIKQFKL
ncbi:MAG: hypothetical protein V7735_22260 [Photobacterium frigidiphilum]|uniref:hypothetical protein n=1 Tax=Photobacterium frigidiphilum TaxID=264736 RepID=UPI00300199EA